MRTCRFRRGGRESWGVVEPGGVRALTDAPWSGGLAEGPLLPVAEVELLAPVAPSKIVCVGWNYASHARELRQEVPKAPRLFLKPSTAVIGPGQAIRLPRASSEVHHEAELAVVVGRTLTDAQTAAEAREAVFGFTCLNDVTARDIQRASGHFTGAKGFDTFCPIGPVVETNLDPMEAVVLCRVNGEQRQRGLARDMAFDPYLCVAHASQVMTLLPGDVVSTGTPEGVGPIRRGDWVEIEVSGIGVLKNPVT